MPIGVENNMRLVGVKSPPSVVKECNVLFPILLQPFYRSCLSDVVHVRHFVYLKHCEKSSADTLSGSCI